MAATQNMLKQIQCSFACVTTSNQGFEKSRPGVRSGVSDWSWKKLMPLVGVSRPVWAG